MPILNQSAIFVGRVVWLPQRMYKYVSSLPPCRLNIIFDRGRIPVREREIKYNLPYREFCRHGEIPLEMAGNITRKI